MAAEMYDVAIVGGGPAGYTAGIYASRYGLKTILITGDVAGGQIATSDKIDNYPGLPHVSGIDLMRAFEKQAIELGTEEVFDVIETLEITDGRHFILKTFENAYSAKSIIVATGATPATAGFEGEDTFKGRGVSYCATCDGMFFKGKKVFVIGGGNSACQEALYLSNIVSDVVMVIRRDAFRAPEGIVHQILSKENISVRYQTKIINVSGEALPSKIAFHDLKTDTTYVETYEQGQVGIFVFTGTNPNIDLIKGLVDITEANAVKTDARMQTRTPGLFCAGDIRETPLRQVITASADGAIAAASAYAYVKESNRV